MSDSYLPGAAVLAHSLRDAGTTKKLAALVTLDTLSADTVTELKALYDHIIPVERIRNPTPANLFLMGRPDLSFAFTKINLWRQTQFRKIVYLDADVVALRALDDLFELDARFAASPDVGWPDAFNSGFMVLTPNMGDYWALQTMAAAGDSFDGADQGLLNQYYEHRGWHRLPFTYNVTPNAQYQWEPAYRYYKRDIGAVHFIGKDKPWSTGRTGPVGSGVYNELLARWWAVYDRHLKAATAPGSSGVGAHVQGETTSADFGTSSIQHLTQIPTIVEPEGSATHTEAPLSEPGEAAENIDQGVVDPTPTSQQRKFSAPVMQWDATKYEPPMESIPEASNFPTETYEFSGSHRLFQAPQQYPEPPKDMWYQVPEVKPKPAEPPKPIFPWEQQVNRPKPTRVFAEDLPTSPVLTPVPSAPGPASTSSTHPFPTTHYEQGADSSSSSGAAGVASPERPSSPKTADEQWQAFQQSNANAWDSVPGIDTYVRAIMESQTKRGKPSVLHNATGTDEILSPSLSRKERRESLILTDFPTAVERPSLPVTPAPIKRPSFWGEEGEGELPAAEGVPQNQAEWVCPQCGFSSVTAADFKPVRRESSSASTATAFATPSPSTVYATSASNPPKVAPDILPALPEVGPETAPTIEVDPEQLSPKSVLAEPPKLAPLAQQKGETAPATTAQTDTAPATTAQTDTAPTQSRPQIRRYKSLKSPPRYGPISLRQGVSPSGAPLASLTDPTHLPAPTHFPGMGVPSSSASDVPPPVAASDDTPVTAPARLLIDSEQTKAD
ncbi:nucleotide-diphospho-sugar transferase [Lophiotrema nucula]|uniref:glycogenin glucosyltransferase n=1 Tax=Lophiotrema nucula TaxID=690887 RepID=A0A6A5YIG3_9PLEO|nr:nucleotide-diphospho-sugar transferase [Lophiotrema nucula]